MIYPTIGLSRRLEREESGYGRCNIDVQRDRGATGGGCAARSGGSSPFAPWCQGAEHWILDNRPGQGQRLSILVWESADAMSAAMPSVMAAVKRRRDEAGLSQPQRSPDSSRRFDV